MFALRYRGSDKRTMATNAKGKQTANVVSMFSMSFIWFFSWCFSLPLLATAPNIARIFSASITKFAKGNGKPRFTYAKENAETLKRGGNVSGKGVGIARPQYVRRCHTLPASNRKSRRNTASNRKSRCNRATHARPDVARQSITR
jgi:hypothetical protein